MRGPYLLSARRNNDDCSEGCPLCEVSAHCRRHCLLDLISLSSNEQLRAHTTGLPTIAPRTIVLFQPEDSISSVRLAVRLLTGYEKGVRRSNDEWFTVLGPYVHPNLAGTAAATSSTLIDCLSALRSDRSIFVVANDTSVSKIAPWRQLRQLVGMPPSMLLMRVSARAHHHRTLYRVHLDLS